MKTKKSQPHKNGHVKLQTPQQLEFETNFFSLSRSDSPCLGGASSATHEEIPAANRLVHAPQALPAKTGTCPFPALFLSVFALFLVWQGGCAEKTV